MTRRNAVRQAAAANAQAIDWVQTHTLRDLENLVNEMSDLGADVNDIVGLLDDLREIDRGLHLGAEPVPEACEYA